MNTSQKAEPFERFIEHYLRNGFGSLGKRETDRLIFLLLVDMGYLSMSSGPFSISRTLKVSLSKAANLLYEYNLLAPIQRQSDWLRTELATLLSNTHLAVEQGGKIKLNVENRLLREELEHFIKSIGTAPDYSFNRNILVIDLETFSRLIEKMALPEQFASLSKELKKHKSELGSAISGKDLLMKFLSGVAEEAGRKTVDLSWLLASGGTNEIVSCVRGFLNK